MNPTNQNQVFDVKYLRRFHETEALSSQSIKMCRALRKAVMICQSEFSVTFQSTSTFLNVSTQHLTTG